MINRYLIPFLALIGIIGGISFALRSAREDHVTLPVAAPASSPYGNFIAGAGIVEANSENIAIGTPVGGVVSHIFVKVGDQVTEDAPLFELDGRELKAELALAENKLTVAEASVAEAEATLKDLNNQLEIAEELANRAAGSRFDRDRRKYAVSVGTAKLASSKAQVQAARAEVARSKTQLERLTVRAPITGEILKVNLRLGEFAPTGDLRDPLILMGNTDPLHVRVDIDENDAWRFKPDTKAQAALRGNPDMKSDLAFVRTEPYVTPKRSLTGDSTERVDTRVLQVIYSFPKSALPAHVGQLVDVFIEAPK